MIDGADTAWLLTSSVLVLMMTLPALGFFYGGLVQAKNILSVLVAVRRRRGPGVAAVVRLRLQPGLFRHRPMARRSQAVLPSNAVAQATHPRRHQIPESVFVMFQMTFAIITPALIIGAYVERIRFGAVLLFSALWLLRRLCAGGALGVGRRLAGRTRRDGFCRRHRRAS